MSADRETLADVLDGHYPAPIVDGSIINHGCCCGWASGLSLKSEWGGAHREHVAQAIRDHLTALAGDAGVREVVSSVVHEARVSRLTPPDPSAVNRAVAAFLGCVG